MTLKIQKKSAQQKEYRSMNSLTLNRNFGKKKTTFNRSIPKTISDPYSKEFNTKTTLDVRNQHFFVSFVLLLF